MHIILNVVLTLDKIKPSPTELNRPNRQSDMDTSEINNDARFAADDNNKVDNMGSINSTVTHTSTDCNCKSLPTTCASRKENENGLSKSFISFIQSKRKQQQLNKERRREAKQLSLNYNMLKRGEYACVHVCVCVCFCGA